MRGGPESPVACTAWPPAPVGGVGRRGLRWTAALWREHIAFVGGSEVTAPPFRFVKSDMLGSWFL